MNRSRNATSGCTSAAIANAVNTHATTRWASSAISRTSTVTASASTIASAERSERVTCGRADRATVRAPSAIDSYDTDVADENAGPSADAGVDVDPRSAIPLAVAFASLAILVWFVRSVPRTITALAI